MKMLAYKEQTAIVFNHIDLDNRLENEGRKEKKALRGCEYNEGDGFWDTFFEDSIRNPAEC